MRMADFIHLHNHSEYSLLDGSIRLQDLIFRAQKYDMPAVALTDHGVLYGMIKFYRQAKDAGIKPIIGCEVYVTPGDHRQREDRELYHLVLLASNRRGYHNLIRLVTKSHIDGFYYKPRVDKELLYRHSEGLIATSACLEGEIPRLLDEGRVEEAEESLKEYIEIYGRDDFFLELQDHRLRREKQLNPELIELADEFNLELIASNDCHYLDKSDAEFHDVLLALQTNSEIDDEDRLTFPNDEFYFKSPEEMQEIFSGVPEALKNTTRIAGRCSLELDFNQFHLPEYPEAREKNISPEEMLRNMCREALEERFPDDGKARERMEYELDTICEMGYAAYFLIVQDFVREAEDRGIRVGPGRGSAAGSFVSYLLGITKVNPLKYGLIFERFLNPERVSLPDIDIDFDERRDEIIEYVSERYGKERVAQIGTFGTMAARGAVRDVGRVMGMDYDRVDRVAKAIPRMQDDSLAEIRKSSSRLQDMEDEDEEISGLLDRAEKVEGLPRHISTHAAGVIIGPEPLIELIPLQKQDETRITQLPMEDLEALGLLKMDFLGLRNLTVIEDTLDRIKDNHDRSLDIDSVALDDEEVYRMLGRGDTAGVFQMESRLFQDLTSRLQPDRFSDLIALLALGRPGPLGSGLVDDYIKCRRGEKEPQYLHPSLRAILEETFGLILYQEQVMEIASKLGNFSMGEADILRRGMGKKKEKLVAEERGRFVQGARENDIPEETAHEIFDQMEYFSGYGFNKSHSAAYALLAYQTAYLKTKYPVEFMAALLTSVMGNLDKVGDYINSARDMGLEILPPDVNESRHGFAGISTQEIRFGLKAIKHLGSRAIEEIIKQRNQEGKFEDLIDFLERSDLSCLQKNDVEALIRAGACDSFATNRAQMLAALEELYDRVDKRGGQKARGQTSFFDLVEDEDSFYRNEFEFPAVNDLSQQEKLKQEREYLGLYLSGHPLDPYKDFIKSVGADHNISSKASGDEGEFTADSILTAGIVTDMREHMTRNERKMAFLTVENRGQSIDVIVFPGTYRGAAALLSTGQAVLIYGELDDEQIIAERVIPLNDEAVILENKGFTEQEAQNLLERLESSGEGGIPLLVRDRRRKKGQKLWLIPEKFWPESEDELKRGIEDAVQKAEVKIFNFSCD